MAPDPIVSLSRIESAFGGLRPLRIDALSLAPGECLAVTGVDALMAEGLVSLITGARLPDRGEVSLFGRATSAIGEADDWLASLDRIGIVSARAVLLDDLTAFQNVAMAFTLSIDRVPDAVGVEVRGLAAETGLAGGALERPLRELAPLDAARCHLARALAASPGVLILEHANVLAAGEAPAFGRVIRQIALARGLALLVLTADEPFARVVSSRVCRFDPATGRMIDRTGWRRWVRMGRS